jgi:superfamily II DNA or RNA helicase
MMLLSFDYQSSADYANFIKLKSLPSYSWKGRMAVVPDSYAHLFTTEKPEEQHHDAMLSDKLFDYQRDIAITAIRKKKYAIFAECGLGKTLIMLEFARHAARHAGKTLIVSPLMVIPQTIAEAERFYPGTKIGQVAAADLQYWLNSDDPFDSEIGITNYEAIRDGISAGNLKAICLDEASLLKSHYGAWGERLIEMGAGLEYKLTMTGTPAPNDRNEYANQAVFVDAVRTTNEFLARYFVNRGETQNRWEIKPHALRPFYRDLSHWCIFLNNPSTYGWKDNCDTIPPIHVHIDSIPLTNEQRKASQEMTGNLFVNEIGGIGQRGKLSQMAKGKNGMRTNKPEFIRKLVESWPEESTIIWCRYNDEQDSMERVFPGAASIRGDTPIEERIRLVNDFKSGSTRILISKPKILGFGLNLQIATRHVFSGLQDSYEEFHQAVKRSNRIGSTMPLNVHIPVTELEEPMIQTVLRKAHRVEMDAAEQELEFKRSRFSEATDE